MLNVCTTAQLPTNGHVPLLAPVQHASGTPAAVQILLGSQPSQLLANVQAVPSYGPPTHIFVPPQLGVGVPAGTVPQSDLRPHDRPSWGPPLHVPRHEPLDPPPGKNSTSTAPVGVSEGVLVGTVGVYVGVTVGVFVGVKVMQCDGSPTHAYPLSTWQA